MRLLRALQRLHRHDPSAFRPFVVAGVTVGAVRPAFAARLTKHPAAFDVAEDRVALRDRLADFAQRMATCYDVRYDTEVFTAATWAAASPGDGEPMLQAPGSTETFVVQGLDPDTTVSSFYEPLDFHAGGGPYRIGCAYSDGDSVQVGPWNGTAWHTELVVASRTAGPGIDFAFAPDGGRTHHEPRTRRVPGAPACPGPVESPPDRDRPVDSRADVAPGRRRHGP